MDVRRAGAGAHLLAAVLLLAAAVVAGRVWTPSFWLFGAAFLVVVAAAAHRWPLATLVAGALATLADPVLVPRLAPAGLGAGPIGLSEPILAVAGAIVVVDAVRSGRWRAAVADPVTALVALFVGLAVVSAAVNAVPPIVALLGIVMTVDAIAMYVVVRASPTDEHRAGLAIAAVVAATVLVAVIGIGQVVVHPDLLGLGAFDGRFGEGARITAFLGNPNPVAMVLSLGIGFALFAGVGLPGLRERWVARAVLLVLVLALLFTFSRSGWIAVGVGVTLVGALVDWRALLLFAVTLLLAIGLFNVTPRGLALDPEDRTATPFPPDLVDTTADRFGNLGEAGDTRRRYLVEGVPILLDHPWLGVGPGRYGGAAATILESPVYAEYDTGLYGYRTIHSFWQHLLGESGALGTAAFLAMLGGLVRRFTRAARATAGRRRAITAGAAAVVVVTGLHSLTEMIYEGNLPALLIWLLLGLASLFAPVRPILARDAPGEEPALSG